MKCPVCYTTIPLGESICPNCGMRVKKDKQVQLHDTPPSSHKKTSHKKTIKITSIISIAFSLLVSILMIRGLFVDTGRFISIFHNNDEIGYSEDVYIQFLNNRITGLNQLGFDVDENSGVSLYEVSQECDLYIYASKDDLEYTINYTFYQSDITSMQLEITGSYEGSKSESYQYLNEADVNDLGYYLEFGNTYSLFKDAHERLIKDNENPNQRYALEYYNNYEITVHESFEKDTNTTLFYYSISK